MSFADDLEKLSATTGTAPPPMTSTFRGYRSDPIPFTQDEHARALIHAQAVLRWRRSLSRLGRLLNRLQGVKPVGPAVSSASREHLRVLEGGKN